MKFNREKYIDLINYILTKCYSKPNLGKTVLCSIMYFIDFGYYELYGKFITQETYIKSKKGIEPKHFKEITEELIATKKLFLRKEPYYHRIIHRYYPTIIPQFTFSDSELELIDFSIKKLSDNNASTILKYAIKDPPLHMADLGEDIDYKYVFCRNNKYSTIKIKNNK